MTAVPLTGSHPIKVRRLVLWLALAVLFSGIGYALARQIPLWLAKPVVTATAAAGCDLQHTACSADFADGVRVSLAIAPQPLRANQALSLQVHADGLAAQQVEVRFSGVDMNMGLIDTPLSANADGSFRGQTTLSICIRQRMTWRAEVSVEGRDTLYRTHFDFQVTR